MKSEKMAKCISSVDTILTKFATNIGILFFVCMMIIVLMGIVMRFILRIPNIYGEEIALHLLYGSTLVGITVGIRSKSHLGIEGFTNSLPKAAGKKVTAIVSLVVMMLYAFLCKISFDLACSSMQFNSLTSALDLPYYTIYFATACVFAVCLLQSALLFVNDFILDEPVLKVEGGGTLA